MFSIYRYITLSKDHILRVNTHGFETWKMANFTYWLLIFMYFHVSKLNNVKKETGCRDMGVEH